MKDDFKIKQLLVITALLVFAFGIVTYIIALSFQKYDLLEQVGSADAWIGFAGSAMGGVITMLALYFTLKSNIESRQQDKIAALKPYLVCHITNLDESERKILIPNCINNYGFIECEMLNISNNIANEIRIVDQYSQIQRGEGQYEKMDDLQQLYGISIFTVSLNDGTFLAPHETYHWRTNLCVSLDDNGAYMWNDSALDFKHTIVFAYTDITNAQTYMHRFEFEININVDIHNDLHFFLWNISNSMLGE